VFSGVVPVGGADPTGDAATTPLTTNPVLERALEVLFILHADQQQNCSTSAMRLIGSALADPYSALAGAAAALYGPLHGGANDEVQRMLQEIGSPHHIPAFLDRVRHGETLLMGFGHRVYKNDDPRARPAGWRSGWSCSTIRRSASPGRRRPTASPWSGGVTHARARRLSLRMSPRRRCTTAGC
jgi:citrate synthase